MAGISEKKIFKNIHQIGIVTHDARKTIKDYINNYGIGPWDIYYFNSPAPKDNKFSNDTVYNEYKAAVCIIEDVELVLLEPENLSRFTDAIKKRVQGPYFVSFEVDDYEKSLKTCDGKKIETIYSGKLNGRRFSFLNTYRDLKFIACILEYKPGFIKPEPDMVYP